MTRLSVLLTTLLAASLATGSRAGDLEEVVIVAPYGAAISNDRVPGHVQFAGAEDVQRLQPFDLTDFLDRGFSGVSVNHAQNNPLQPDVYFRGFSASPLLGMAQGLAVYANGVRANEPFGDTVNWDLIPVTAIRSIQLGGGARPMFGENALGGALVVRFKDGFDSPGTALEGYGGSFGRAGAVIQGGGNDGTHGWYGSADYLSEDGWRDHSKTEAVRGFGSFAIEGEKGRFETSVLLGHTRLRGNGPSPVELLAEDRRAVFTWPDETRNDAAQITVEAERSLPADWRLSGNIFWRHAETDTFNGDATPFEACGDPPEFLTEVDCNDPDAAPLLDSQGQPLPAELDGDELDAINNLGTRTQQSRGLSLQLTRDANWRGELRNNFVAGFSLTRGDTKFDSDVELASLREDRSTTRTDLRAWELRTRLDTVNTVRSAWIADTLDLTPEFTLSLAARYDVDRVSLEDRTGTLPELNGEHEFTSFNPSLGFAWRPIEGLVAYANVGRTSRAPTPVELACASEDAPCNLPNAFLADPPLDKVVAESFEGGLRGRWHEKYAWHAGLFRVVNRDDILFQATGGAQSNIGFFQNIADTRRQGIEAGVQGTQGPLTWSLEYALVDATFQDSFIESSPNHPDAVDGLIEVPDGARIPSVARNLLNAGVDYRRGRWSLGADLSAQDGVYLRGDEANLLGRTGSFWTANVRAEYRFNEAFELFVRIENLFDREYETFGLLGEPDEVFEEFEDPRFLGAGPPFGAWIGVRLRL